MMIPTAKLQMVNRDVQIEKDGQIRWTTSKVLQQWWEPQVDIGWAVIPIGDGEWRDVPDSSPVGEVR